MTARLFYTPNTPGDQDVQELQRRLKQHGIALELVDADSREGTALGELYDLVARPSVLVTDSSGQLIQQWQTMLPRAEDVAAVFATS